MADMPIIAEPTGCLVIKKVIRPVRLLFYIPVLVVELGIEQYQACQLGRTLRGVVGRETATEARSYQADSRCSRLLAQMSQRHPNVVQVRTQRVVLLPTLALPMATEV